GDGDSRGWWFLCITLRGRCPENRGSSKEGSDFIDRPYCSRFRRAVEFVGRRWMGEVLLFLMKRPHRFNELLAAIPGISDRMLTARLRELEACGLAERKVLP